jgi:hypothetical protein
VCSSRLGTDQFGRQTAVVTTPGAVPEVGALFLVLDGHPYGLVPERGRLATAEEQLEARPPYQPGRSRTERERRPEIPDALLAEEEAIRLSRLEQQRQPVDLLSAVPTTLAPPALSYARRPTTLEHLRRHCR